MADPVRSPRYWIVVGSLDNFRRTAELGFTIQGMKSRHRKKAARMAAGDQIAYYVTGLKVFGGTATIVSPCFESHDRIWTSTDPRKAAEDYPFRVRITPGLILPEAEFVPAAGVARELTYVAKWPEHHWTLAFQGNVHGIEEADFETIRDAIAARVPVGAGLSDGASS
ncbi:MAG: EVE domain-containing protein [Chloroflexota bacterium]|nr:EVE domain-containing protein [Chloroflexota bacterium]